MFSKITIKNRFTEKILFRKYSRKKFAAFNSMHKVVHIATLIVAYGILVAPMQGNAQTDTIRISDTHELEEVEIVGQKSPGLFEDISRMVSIVSQPVIESSPSQSLTDLLSYTSNIDIRQRGKNAIQSDVSIRGGSFDHSLILLNGINLSDPQTGHLSLHLPLETEAISRIEILNGPAARVHGTNAFSGAVNFVTNPLETNQVLVHLSGGSYNFGKASASINAGGNNFRQLLHFNLASSAGYIENTDFFKQGIFYQGQFFHENGIFDFQIGHSNRKFGANSFYTPKYPDQFEQNQLSFVALSYKTGNKVKVKSGFYWRRHHDRWEMFREDKDWYKVENGMSISLDTAKTRFDTTFVYTNHHINDVVGAKLDFSTKTIIGVTSLGLHARSENIISTSIGYDKGISIPVRGYDSLNYTRGDNRAILDMHIEQTFSFNPLYVSTGLLINWNSYLPEEVNVFPGIDMRLRLFSWFYLTASYNYTLGIPTFTDLTYRDPNNVGNNDLLPYTQHSYENGIRLRHKTGTSSISYFTNWGKNVIDWLWYNDQEKFKPANIESYNCQGIEIFTQHQFNNSSMDIPFMPGSVRASYTYIKMNKKIPAEVIKYFNIKQKFALMLTHNLRWGLTMSWNVSYTEREGSYLDYNFDDEAYITIKFNPYWLVDLRLAYTYNWLYIYIETTNLLNTDYIDIGSIKQPGSWLTLGVKVKLSKKQNN